MPKGPRKVYLDPNSKTQIPRSTLYQIKQYNRCQHNSQSTTDGEVSSTPEIRRDTQLSSRDAFEYEEQTSSLNSEVDEFRSEMDDTVNQSNGTYEHIIRDNDVTISNHEEVAMSPAEINYEDLFEADGLYATSTPNQLGINNDNANGYNFTQGSSDNKDIPQPADYQRDPYLDEPICQCSTTTRGEVMLMCLSLGRRHSLTWTAMCDILKLINTLTMHDAVPTTKYMSTKYFPLQQDSIKYHCYCPECENYIGDRSEIRDVSEISCGTCRSTFQTKDISSFFLTLNFRSQLAELLKNPELVKALGERFTRKKKNESALEEIYDGNIYKKLTAPGEILSNKYNLSYTFNTDGCQSANSSRVTIWPIYCMINEFPHHLRARHMLLAGVWVAKREPNMNLFLQPFVDEANNLSTVGLRWKCNDGKMVTSKVIPICCCVDSIARPAMLNMKQFNGFYGCTFCEHPTENVCGQRKYPISTEVPPDRTDNSIRRDMLLAHSRGKKKEDVNGVWGPSCLMNLKYFDMADGMVPDDLHAVFLGVVKQHTEIVLTSPGEEYYVGDPNNLGIVDNRLLSIKPPSCITRTPRSITERRLWKASEWRSWLVWYSLICLDGVLPKKYIEHLAFLVTAIAILLQDSITPVMLEYANQLLVRYVVQFQEFFTKQAMTFNVHLLLHLGKSVANWGPLWTHTAFPFENENRLLLELKKSPVHVATQIARKFIMHKALSTACETILISDRVKIFCKELSEDRLQFYDKANGVVLVGSGKPHTLSVEEQRLIGCNTSDCRVYERMIYNNVKYTVDSYERSKKTCNAVVITHSGLIGIIDKICKLSEHCETQVRVLIKEIEIGLNSFVNVSHIKQCRIRSRVSHAISPNSLNAPGILFHIDDKYFVSSIPRGCLRD